MESILFLKRDNLICIIKLGMKPKYESCIRHRYTEKCPKCDKKENRFMKHGFIVNYLDCLPLKNLYSSLYTFFDSSSARYDQPRLWIRLRNASISPARLAL